MASEQPAIQISRADYADRVLACWLGKNIGGTLGAPFEGQMRVLNLSFYDPIPWQAAANDDLDLQLVWLHMLEEVGVDPKLPHFADYWQRFAKAYPWNEYGFFMRNAARGLAPPIAGCFENYFVDEMGSPIRSEIWACLYPANPDRAAEMAWRDSAIDHAGGEGTHGEMFWAAVQSAAFVESDPLTLIGIGLNVIPIASHVSRAIREVVWCYQNHLTWAEARERIATRFGSTQPCNAVPNHGFTVIGWLYGTDFGDQMCKAVNCGFDTDCTGATLGSLLGILHGTAGIPAIWLEPIGRGITLNPLTAPLKDFAPKTVDELTARTIKLAEQAAKLAFSPIVFGDEAKFPADLRSRLFVNDRAIRSRNQDPHMGTAHVGDQQIELHYHGDPVLHCGIEKTLHVTVDGHACDGASMSTIEGVQVTRRAGSRFVLSTQAAVPDRVLIKVTIEGVGDASFTILGPGEARGFAAGANVASCRLCGARVESCLCDPDLKRRLSAVRWMENWQVIGPYAGDAVRSVRLDTATPADHLLSADAEIDFARPIGERSWKVAVAGEMGLLDLAAALGPHEWSNAVAATTFESDSDQDMTLLVGSDDGILLALNGVVVHSFEGGRSVATYDVVRVRVRAGVNRLIAKVDNYTGGWALRVGVTPEP